MNFLNQSNGHHAGHGAAKPQARAVIDPLDDFRGTVLITGGAGFIGINLADRLLRAGHRVILLDNLVRPGVEHNLRWLEDCHGSALDVRIADVRQSTTVHQCVADALRRAHARVCRRMA